MMMLTERMEALVGNVNPNELNVNVHETFPPPAINVVESGVELAQAPTEVVQVDSVTLARHVETTPASLKFSIKKNNVKTNKHENEQRLSVDDEMMKENASNKRREKKNETLPKHWVFEKFSFSFIEQYILDTT
jgi:hypothetical protein